MTDTIANSRDENEGGPTTKRDTPYFSNNRDETDVAYERGWDDAKARKASAQPYQKQSLKTAYRRGFEAGRT